MTSRIEAGLLEDPSHLDRLAGLDWLVAARNDIQTLLLEILNRWPTLENASTSNRVLGCAFSLWRAVFLIGSDGAEKKLDEADGHTFLKKLVETNAITFVDELTNRSWASGYYVDNAIDHLRQLAIALKQKDLGRIGVVVRADHILTPKPTRLPLIRSVWNAVFRELQWYVLNGDIPGTTAKTKIAARRRKSTTRQAR